MLSLLDRFPWYLIIAMFNSFSSIFKALASRWRTSWHMTFSGKNLHLFSKLFVWCPIQDFIFSLADIFFSNFSPPRIKVGVGDRIFKNRKVEKKTSIGWETNIKHQQDWYQYILGPWCVALTTEHTTLTNSSYLIQYDKLSILENPNWIFS